MRQVSSSARRALVVAAAAILSGAIIFSAHAQSASPSLGKQAVENRKAVYALIGNYFRYFGAVAKGTVAYDEAEATKRAGRIVFLSGLIEENFPDSSNLGEPESKSKADIWGNRADFDKKLKDFQSHATALVEVNGKEKSATDTFKNAVAALGQDCKGCHDSYKLK